MHSRPIFYTILGSILILCSLTTGYYCMRVLSKETLFPSLILGSVLSDYVFYIQLLSVNIIIYFVYVTKKHFYFCAKCAYRVSV